jgi:5-methyltetrahydrofolate--homocysteine methyltransferase
MNAAFLSMAIGAGMTSAITNPLHEPEMAAVKGANAVMGRDPNCANWIRTFREPAAEGSDEARRAGRRRKRNA